MTDTTAIAYWLGALLMFNLGDCYSHRIGRICKNLGCKHDQRKQNYDVCRNL
jgi:hypothetical protein